MIFFGWVKPTQPLIDFLRQWTFLSLRVVSKFFRTESLKIKIYKKVSLIWLSLNPHLQYFSSSELISWLISSALMISNLLCWVYWINIKGNEKTKVQVTRSLGRMYPFIAFGFVRSVSSYLGRVYFQWEAVLY